MVALADPTTGTRRSKAILGIFILTLFTGSALLFLVQPMFAKMVLPLLGGTPAVWATSMVFFQATLLAGYAYAHWSVSRLGVRRQALVHIPLVLLPLLLLPISVPAGWSPPPEGRPAVWLLWLLAYSLGLPFFVLSTSAPLLQRWFATTGHPSGKDPYFLYAASNAGSMLALLSYPFLMEPSLPLQVQSTVWAVAYGALAAGTIVCAWLVLNADPRDENLATAGDEAAEDGTDLGGTSEQQAEVALASEQEAAEPAVVAEQHAAEQAAGAQAADQQAADQSVVAEQAVVAPAPPMAPAPMTPAPMAPGPVTGIRRFRWVALAFVPSTLMLAVTNYISTDIAAIPLLWVIPLALYLLTFILVFSTKPVPLGLAAWAQVALVVPLVLMMLTDIRGVLPRAVLFGLPLLALFVFSLVCHAQLAIDRPPPRHLTEFYLWVAVGGVLGGIFTALVAPAVFETLLEYPVAIVLACLLLPALGKRRMSNRMEQLVLVVTFPALILITVLQILGTRGWLPNAGRTVAVAVTLGICWLFATRPFRFGVAVAAVMIGATIARVDESPVLFSERTFFGIQQVLGDPAGRFHRLMHGTTLHGIQSTDPALKTEPLSYYHREGPIGQVMTALPAAEAPRIGVVGLGTGTMACYARPGQHWTFFEIDPVMERIARDPALFTFLADCPGEHEVVLGDARLSLEDVPDGSYGVLVVDAFNSDAIPVHLLTREAIDLYVQKLAPGGVVAIHISNRYLDLTQVLADLARDRGLESLYGSSGQTLERLTKGKSASDWVVLARAQEDLGSLAGDPQWTSLVSQPGSRVWTDDFSDVFSVFRWRPYA